jgi:toxin CcdB
MAQFDVRRTRSGSAYPLVVDVQADVHSMLVSRIVAPMAPRARYAQPLTRLTPTVKVRDTEYVVVFPLMASVPHSSLGELIGSLAADRAIVIGALDLLITGS